MNKLLKEKADITIKTYDKYFSDLKKHHTLITYLCDSLSSFGYYNACNEIIENELFNIFMYLYNNNKELSEKTLTNKNNKTPLYQETLKTINELTKCIITIDHLYDDIIALCNTMTQKLYNINYEEFLVEYIKEEKEIN